MWTRRCTIERKRGGLCTRRSTMAYWCWGFRGERFESPTWIEVCGHHAIDIEGQISSVEIHRAR